MNSKKIAQISKSRSNTDGNPNQGASLIKRWKTECSLHFLGRKKAYWIHKTVKQKSNWHSSSFELWMR